MIFLSIAILYIIMGFAVSAEYNYRCNETPEQVPDKELICAMIFWPILVLAFLVKIITLSIKNLYKLNNFLSSIFQCLFDIISKIIIGGKS